MAREGIQVLELAGCDGGFAENGAVLCYALDGAGFGKPQRNATGLYTMKLAFSYSK